jgi:hypothetical protein
MFVRVLAGVFALALIGACSGADYGDAGADRPLPPTRTVDLDNTGNAVCPGDFLTVVSDSRAVCTNAPQRCTVNPGAANRIVCYCTGAGDAGAGSWSCRYDQP